MLKDVEVCFVGDCLDYEDVEYIWWLMLDLCFVFVFNVDCFFILVEFVVRIKLIDNFSDVERVNVIDIENWLRLVIWNK